MTSHEAKIIKEELLKLNIKTISKNQLVDWYIEFENETTQNQNVEVKDLLKVAEAAGITVKQNLITFEGVPTNFVDFDKEKKAQEVLTKENLQKLISEGYPQIDIAEKLGVTRGQVQYALKKYGLEAPTMKEKVAALYK
jgi:transcriptional regulator with GAF, ATPase, and Fis domain